MKHDEKTKEVFLNELEKMNQRINELELSKKKIKKSEEMSWKILDTIPDLGMLLRNDDWTVLALNESMANSFGKDKNNLIGRKFLDEFPTDIARLREKDFKKVMLGKSISFEDYRNGKCFYSSIYPIFDSKGTITHSVIFSHEITDWEKTKTELKKSNEMLLQERNMFISGPVVVFKWKNQEEWPVEYVSSNVKDVMGYTAKDFLSQNIKYGKIVHVDDLERVSNEVTTYSKSDAVNFEHKPYRITKKDGEVIWINDYTTILRDKAGNITHYLGYVVDITMRKQAEEQSKLLSSSVKQSTEGIAVSDLEGNLLFVNDAFLLMHGYNQENLIGKNLSIFHDNEQILSVKMLIKHVLENGKFSGESNHVRRDGTVFPVMIRNSLLSDENGKPVGMIVTIRDVTRIKKAEEETLRAKEHLKNVIDSASEIIIAVDKNDKISTWNKTAEIIIGYNKREVIGKLIASLGIFEDEGCLKEHIENIYEGNFKPVDQIIKTKNGAKKLLQFSCSIIKGDNEDISGVLMIGKDITQDVDVHGQLLEGGSYLITDENSESALNLFRDLAVTNYNGLFITRGTPDAIRNAVSSLDAKTIVLSQDIIGEFEHVYELDNLINSIKEFIENEDKPIIFFDRIDYFLTNFSFETVIKSLYRLSDIVSQSNAVLLLRLKPSIVDIGQMALLKEEFQLIPSQKIENLELEEYLYIILKFIHDQNQQNMLVSYRKISQKFSISKVTTAKRLNILKEKELILIKSHGKAKSVHISEKGKTLLHKRKVI